MGVEGGRSVRWTLPWPGVEVVGGKGEGITADNGGPMVAWRGYGGAPLQRVAGWEYGCEEILGDLTLSSSVV